MDRSPPWSISVRDPAVRGPHELHRPAFSGDTGAADPELVAHLAALDGTAATRLPAVRALATARVFVPVTAALTTDLASASPGLDKHAEMALVTITGRDGRRAVPAFTSAAALLAWHPDVRPVPVEGARAARTALDDGAAAVLVDPGQPTQLVVTGSELDQLAAVWSEATGGGPAG
ncbi:MAG: SseB family protein [Sporichthyaceae bacterium]|nr:SseB family protein [Sporichthyaceae bacterium]